MLDAHRCNTPPLPVPLTKKQMPPPRPTSTHTSISGTSTASAAAAAAARVFCTTHLSTGRSCKLHHFNVPPPPPHTHTQIHWLVVRLNAASGLHTQHRMARTHPAIMPPQPTKSTHTYPPRSAECLPRLLLLLPRDFAPPISPQASPADCIP